MLAKEEIIKLAKENGKVTTKEVAALFGVSRQYANIIVGELVTANELVKIGSTIRSFYVLPEFLATHPEILPLRYAKKFQNKGLEEHKVLDDVERKLSLAVKLPENIWSIFTYAFSEMLNNAIEHSHSPMVGVEVFISGGVLSFEINDSGIGVFKSVMKKKNLRSELEAIQDILKGKTTTMPRSHSGEGIFFTSKAGDQFILDSYGYKVIFNNQIPDIFVQKVDRLKKGTKVLFKIDIGSPRHLNDIFSKYANQNGDDGGGFDKTEIRVKLYTIGGIYVSRSQARRVLSGLEKFKVILFDFNKVPMVGQAFADEIYRVFHEKYPDIKLEEDNMNEGVKFMVERAKTEALRRKSAP